MLHFIILLIVIGVLLWLLNQYVPMAPPIKQIINIIVIIAVVLFTLNFFGVLDSGFSTSDRYHHEQVR
jgi:hypothetical protein